MRSSGNMLLSIACGTAAVVLCGCYASRDQPPVAPASAPATHTSRAIDWQGPIDVRGIERTYLLHLPPSYDSSTPVPLVLVFHGGRGSGKQIARYTGFNPLADEKGFIVVYPDGLDGHWNDGRPRPSGDGPAPDDVAFVSTLINRLSTMFSIDRNRVYATGISNGAIFAQRLGCELSDKIAAIAPVAGPLAKDLAGQCKPAQPVSVLMIHGTADGFVPYGGGEVRSDIRGEVLSVQETAALWVAADGCPGKPLESTLDPTAQDGTRVRVETWIGGKAGSAVAVYTVDGGGHTWPGAQRGRMAGRVLGPTSQSFSATRTIWEFFELHPKLQ